VRFLRALDQLVDEAADEKLASELYRALAGRCWIGPQGEEVSLSWARAEELVNELRAHAGSLPMTLEATGGEGEVSEPVGTRLAELEWHSRPLDTDSHHEPHLTVVPQPAPGESRPHT
jgi:hypothetical protein